MHFRFDYFRFTRDPAAKRTVRFVGATRPNQANIMPKSGHDHSEVDF